MVVSDVVGVEFFYFYLFVRVVVFYIYVLKSKVRSRVER